MSKERIRTVPNFADTSPVHQAALKAGDEHFQSSQYNVIDRFKTMEVEDIKAELKTTAHPFAVCMENWISDFNFSSLIRNANALGAKEVFYLGDKKYDKRGAVGCFNYIDVSFLPSIDDLLSLKDKYVFIGIDNFANAKPLPEYYWEPNSLMIFGSEGTGLTPMMQGMCKDIVSIPMMGSVRSFNCACASAIVMYDFVRKYRRW